MCKGKVLPECLLAEPVTLNDQIFHASGARLGHYAAELRTLSVTYPLCGTALIKTTEKCLRCTNTNLQSLVLFN